MRRDTKMKVGRKSFIGRVNFAKHVADVRLEPKNR